MCVCVEQQSIGVQENASRPDGLPPSQGGKYVGFGSSPGPSSKPQRGVGGPGGLDDYQQYLSKGISQLTTVAGELKHSGACNKGGGGWGGEGSRRCLGLERGPGCSFRRLLRWGQGVPGLSCKSREP